MARRNRALDIARVSGIRSTTMVDDEPVGAAVDRARHQHCMRCLIRKAIVVLAAIDAEASNGARDGSSAGFINFVLAGQYVRRAWCVFPAMVILAICDAMASRPAIFHAHASPLPVDESLVGTAIYRGRHRILAGTNARSVMPARARARHGCRMCGRRRRGRRCVSYAAALTPIISARIEQCVFIKMTRAC